MWLIDEWGVEKFRAEVEKQLGRELATAAPKDEIDWEKRDHIGIYRQKQPGLNYAGLHIPTGRLYAQDMFDLARMADVYGSGEIRLTVEQNVILPNIPESRLAPFKKEPLLQRFSINPGPLTRALVSCTGAQFCNFALIETKNRALAMMKELEAELFLPKPVRIHWTGCPNSCGQPQVADIGLMGTKTRKNGKTVEGVDIYMGGKVGKDAHLGTCVTKGIPCEDLKQVLGDLLIVNFGAQPKEQFALESVNGNGHRPTAALIIEAPAESKPSSPSGAVVFSKSKKTVVCEGDETILEAAEREGIELASSCRSGICGTCKQKLLKGEVKYTQDPQALDDSDREQGYILACSAQPVGRVVLDA
jgi:ferredoxin-nitrite reductase